MNTKQLATVVRYNHQTKVYYITVWEDEKRNGYTLPVDFTDCEQAENVADAMRTYCPLCFEYPCNEDGSICFY